MRNTFTLLLLLFITTGSAQSVLQKNKPFDAETGYQFKTVCLPQVKDLDPLYIVDGIPVETAELKKINPALIDSVFILKDPQLRNYSCRSPCPVVLNITRHSNNKIIIITDKDGHAPVYGATVTFISSDRRDTLMYVADSAGQVCRKDLKREKTYSVSVTAVGYKSFTGPVKGIKSREIELERDFITGYEVIVSSSGHVISCHRNYISQQQVSQGCGMQTKLVREPASDKVNMSEPCEVSVYPNPVQRGQSVSLKLLQGYFPTGTIRVISLDGKLMATIPVNGDGKQRLLNLPTQQRWASGVYILQLVYANGRVGASEKVILQ